MGVGKSKGALFIFFLFLNEKRSFVRAKAGRSIWRLVWRFRAPGRGS